MAKLPKPALFLIDGYALVYRAFFAMISRPLTTSRGENTSAAWGVVNFLFHILEEYQPDYLVWIHDAGTSFRSETYPEYKATRQKLDEELQQAFNRSIDRIEALLRGFRVPLVTVDGFEADDVIGTLADRGPEQGVHAVIVSGDKDFYQLISPTVSLLNPGRGGPAAVQEEVVTVDNASERLGVPPERVVDYLAMVGDSSDNVPGVKGIGDKTARQLLADYGDLEAILEKAAEIKGKRPREALQNGADAARLSRTLVTIHRDVPVSLDLDAFRVNEWDATALRELFTDLEFHTLIGKLGDDAVVEPSAPVALSSIVGSVSEISDIVRDLRSANVVSMHVEGRSGDDNPGDPVGLTLGVEGGRSWYFPLGHRPPDGDLLHEGSVANLPPLSDDAMRSLTDLLTDPDVPKAGHNLKRNALALLAGGVSLRGGMFDSMIASFLIDPGKRSHDLAVLGREHLGIEVPARADVVGKGKTERPFAEIALAEAADYCGAAVHAVLQLRGQFGPALERTGLGELLGDVEMPLMNVLVEMETRGIKVDTARLGRLATEFREELRTLEQQIYEAAGTDFNINSNPQLRHILFEKLQLPVLKKTKTGPSTDADVLAQLAETYDVPKLLLEYRELEKLRSTYVDALPRSINARTGRIHTSFNQVGAATGRLSSVYPNLQNIPVRTERGGRIRKCFVPEEGSQFIVADYSQVELRLLAHLSHDPAFIEAFRRGGDIHRETAAIIFEVPAADVTGEMRARAKTINFATIYGQGPFALARQLTIPQDEAKAFIAKYFERFAGVRAFLDETIERGRRDGYVETLFGRRRYIPELKEKNYNLRAFGERIAMNSPIQGSAADLIKIAMINLHRALTTAGHASGMLLQVHDELVLEAPDGEVDDVSAMVRAEMEAAAELEVPVVVDVGVGPNWLDAKH